MTVFVSSPEESDGNKVPGKSANNGTRVSAELMEGRTPAKRELGTGSREPDAKPDLRVEWTGPGASECSL
ncbi:MAG: hypothetical protein D8M57_12960 [Candidatus Scalindua sp. AMX11]|nr:MAG: hypothetical protein DWQ00_12130 [Candidatus Scalindua sp.]TDE64405.1 MAG: hypothetical protein D8M57_12960 [Candidatus Scalindua sp. AMX11]